MSKKTWLLPLGIGLLLVLVLGGAALAQDVTPPAPGATPPATAATPGAQAAKPSGQIGLAQIGLQVRWQIFDAVASALNLTPDQLFQQLHGGKTVAQVAQAQGVPVQTVRDAANKAGQAARQDALRKAIDNAEQSGKITSAQANWLRQGLQNGWLNAQLFKRLAALVK